MVVAMDAAAGAGDQGSAAPEAAAGISEEKASTPSKGRAKRPRIDYDESIAQARAAMVKAQKSVAEARRVARNERRKKQRLVKKAASLSPEDLERIAVLKRCGLHCPSREEQAPCAELPATAGSATSGNSGVCRPEPVPAASSDGQNSGRADEPGAGESSDELDRS